MSGVPNALDAPSLSEGLKKLIYTMMSLVCVCSPLALLGVCFCVLFVFVRDVV
jgi:ABC-type polysaccharide/polyol phosphate export permease